MDRPGHTVLTPELIDATGQGDRAAGRRLVDALRPIVHAAVARMILRVRGARGARLRQEIEDLVQEVLVVLLRGGCHKLRSWDPARGRSLPSFVAFITQREVISILRRRDPPEVALEPDLMTTFPDPRSGPEHRAIQRDLVQKIYIRAEAELHTTLAKAMFGWLIVDGLAADEVSELAEMSEAAVYAWRKRLGDLVQRVAADVLSNRTG